MLTQMSWINAVMTYLRGSYVYQVTPAGLEPAIPGSVGRCLIHWATGPIVYINVTSVGLCGYI